MTVFQQLKKEEYDLIEKLNPSELKMTEDQQKEFEKKFKIVGDAEDKVTSEKSFIEQLEETKLKIDPSKMNDKAYLMKLQEQLKDQKSKMKQSKITSEETT